MIIIDLKLNRITKNQKNIASQYSIRGRISKVGVSLPCIVRLYERASGQLIKSVFSGDTGEYVFHNLLKKPYFLVACDSDKQFNAVIQDNVVPK